MTISKTTNWLKEGSNDYSNANCMLLSTPISELHIYRS
jgi:hypothetical protein